MIGMPRILTICLWLIRVLGVLVLILGLVVWVQNAPPNTNPLTQPHMGLGLLMALSIWVFAATSVSAGASVGTAVGFALLGLIMVLFGGAQDNVLPEPNPTHVVIKAVHLLIGLAAMGVAEWMYGGIRRIRLARA
jgi:hypothetical protein